MHTYAHMHTQDPTIYEHLLQHESGNTTQVDALLDLYALDMEALARNLEVTLAGIDDMEACVYDFMYIFLYIYIYINMYACMYTIFIYVFSRVVVLARNFEGHAGGNI